MRWIILAVLLAGCATFDPGRYQRQSTAQICNDLMTLPTYNVNHPDRWAELQRRGASCGHPADVAAGQRAADGQTLQALEMLRRPAPVTCTTQTYGNQSQTVCR